MSRYTRPVVGSVRGMGLATPHLLDVRVCRFWRGPCVGFSWVEVLTLAGALEGLESAGPLPVLAGPWAGQFCSRIWVPTCVKIEASVCWGAIRALGGRLIFRMLQGRVLGASLLSIGQP